MRIVLLKEFFCLCGLIVICNQTHVSIKCHELNRFQYLNQCRLNKLNPKNLYWSKLPMQHGFWRTYFCFYIYPKNILWHHFSTMIKIWLRWKNVFGPRTDEHGSFRRKQEIMLHVELVDFIWYPCVSFNCSLVVNRQCNHYNNYLVFKNTKNWWCNTWTCKWTLDIETGVP